jgi:SAM-dependent methyltransferase
MIDFSKRSHEPELMDDLNLSTPDLGKNLEEIDTINKLLGGNQLTVRSLDSLLSLKKPTGKIKIVDLGCGSGTLLKIICQKLKQKGVQAECLGLDANPYMVEYARQKHKGIENLTFEVMNIFSQEFESLKADIFLATLFFHHFSEQELIGVFRCIRENASLGLIINDLERNPLAYYGISLLTGLFSRSYLTQNDAKLSVLRGFSKAELETAISKSGWENFELVWKWAFRWQVLALK